MKAVEKEMHRLGRYPLLGLAEWDGHVGFVPRGLSGVTYYEQDAMGGYPVGKFVYSFCGIDRGIVVDSDHCGGVGGIEECVELVCDLEFFGNGVVSELREFCGVDRLELSRRAYLLWMIERLREMAPGVSVCDRYPLEWYTDGGAERWGRSVGSIAGQVFDRLFPRLAVPVSVACDRIASGRQSVPDELIGRFFPHTLPARDFLDAMIAEFPG